MSAPQPRRQIDLSALAHLPGITWDAPNNRVVVRGHAAGIPLYERLHDEVLYDISVCYFGDAFMIIRFCGMFKDEATCVYVEYWPDATDEQHWIVAYYEERYNDWMTVLPDFVFGGNHPAEGPQYVFPTREAAEASDWFRMAKEKYASTRVRAMPGIPWLRQL